MYALCICKVGVCHIFNITRVCPFGRVCECACIQYVCEEGGRGRKLVYILSTSLCKCVTCVNVKLFGLGFVCFQYMCLLKG